MPERRIALQYGYDSAIQYVMDDHDRTFAVLKKTECGDITVRSGVPQHTTLTTPMPSSREVGTLLV